MVKSRQKKIRKKNKFRKDRSFKSEILTNQQGQLAIEGVLIVVLLLSLSIFASRYIRDQNLMGKMVSEPWRQIAGMMATGNWRPTQSALDDNLHPHVNTMTREGD